MAVERVVLVVLSLAMGALVMERAELFPTSDGYKNALADRKLNISSVAIAQKKMDLLPATNSSVTNSIAIAPTTTSTQSPDVDMPTIIDAPPLSIPSNCPSAMTESARAQLENQDDDPIISRTDYAIAMIAFGKASFNESKLVERTIQSCRNRGRFRGPILVVTDAPEDRFDHLDGVTVFSVEEQMEAYRQRINAKASLKLHYKRFKMEILKLLESRPELNHVQNVLYMDIDVVVGENLSGFMDYVDQAMANATTLPLAEGGLGNKKSFFLAFAEKPSGQRQTESIHSGVMVLNRQHSQVCLQRWATTLETGFYNRDQSALGNLLRTQRYACQAVVLPTEAYFNLPTERSMKVGNTSTFVHITNTKRAKMISEDVQKQYLECAVLVEGETAIF